MCWGVGSAGGDGLNSPDKGALTGLVIGGSASGADGESMPPAAAAAGDDIDDDSQEPLALLVVHAAMHMLFLPQFTCDFYEEDGHTGPSDAAGTASGAAAGQKAIVLTEAEKKKQEKNDRDAKADAGLITKVADSGVSLKPAPLSIIWAAGAGVSPNELGYDGGTRKYDKNRVEVLRLLLAACCDPLFAPADEYNPLASRWMAVAVAADAYELHQSR